MTLAPEETAPLLTLPPPLSTTPSPASSPPPPTATRRQVTVGTLISETFSVWWANLLKFGALTLLAVLPYAVVVVFMVFSVSQGGDPGGRSILLAMVSVPAAIAMGVVLVSGVTYGAVQHLAGRPVRFGAMFGTGFRRALPLVGAVILAGLTIALGTVLLIVPGIIAYCALAVALPAVVVEKIGPIDAIKRSIDLTRGHRLTFFLASLVLGLFAGFGMGVIEVGLVLGFAMLGPTAGPILLGPTLGLLYCVIAPLQLLLPAVTYQGLRAAKEGVVSDDLVKVFE